VIDNVPNFKLEVGDTLVYRIQENVKSILPDKHQYVTDAAMQLVGKGDTTLKSIEIKFISFDWRWVIKNDTVLLGRNHMGI